MDNSPSSRWVLQYLVSNDSIKTSVVEQYMQGKPVEGLPWDIRLRFALRLISDCMATASFAENVLHLLRSINTVLADEKMDPKEDEDGVILAAMTPSPDLMVQLRTDAALQHLRASPCTEGHAKFLAAVEKHFHEGDGDKALAEATRARRAELEKIPTTTSGMKAAIKAYPVMSVKNGVNNFVMAAVAALGPTFLEMVEADIENRVYPPEDVAAQPTQATGPHLASPPPAPASAAGGEAQDPTQGPDSPGPLESPPGSEAKRRRLGSPGLASPAGVGVGGGGGGAAGAIGGVLEGLRATTAGLSALGEDPLLASLRDAGAARPGHAAEGSAAAVLINQRKAGAQTVGWHSPGDTIEDEGDEPPAPVLPARAVSHFPLQLGGGASPDRRRSGGASGLQQRRGGRWATDEVDKLKDLVSQYPASGGRRPWAKILEQGRSAGVFEGRTDVDLKDKWRNLIKTGNAVEPVAE
mmetsp:Transcript_14637/g.46559  ORF Transcript_14637/g.46559 Transcript_14637/m.46559 type:complete len:468 (-) Transcript_14637:176-1579(-)